MRKQRVRVMNKILVITGSVVFLVAGVGVTYMSTSSKARGIRNNNPLNIEYNKNNDWVGQTGSDGRFARFNKPVYGIRAAAKLIANYYNKYGLRSVYSIVNRWAPSHENDTNNYANFVAKKIGVGVNETITLNKLPQLIAAMIKMENGVQPYSMSLINKAVSLAGV